MIFQDVLIRKDVLTRQIYENPVRMVGLKTGRGCA